MNKCYCSDYVYHLRPEHKRHSDFLPIFSLKLILEKPAAMLWVHSSSSIKRYTWWGTEASFQKPMGNWGLTSTTIWVSHHTSKSSSPGLDDSFGFSLRNLPLCTHIQQPTSPVFLLPDSTPSTPLKILLLLLGIKLKCSSSTDSCVILGKLLSFSGPQIITHGKWR